MLGAAYSLVDLVVASVIGYGVMLGQGVEGHPRVKAWLASVQSRPSFTAMSES